MTPILDGARGSLYFFADSYLAAHNRQDPGPGKITKRDCFGGLTESGLNLFWAAVELQCASKPLSNWQYSAIRLFPVKHEGRRSLCLPS